MVASYCNSIARDVTATNILHMLSTALLNNQCPLSWLLVTILHGRSSTFNILSPMAHSRLEGSLCSAPDITWVNIRRIAPRRNTISLSILHVCIHTPQSIGSQYKVTTVNTKYRSTYRSEPCFRRGWDLRGRDTHFSASNDIGLQPNRALLNVCADFPKLL